MKRMLVLYATRYGHARRIAEHVSFFLRTRGFGTDVLDAARVGTDFSPDLYSAAIVVASVHLGKHEREMVDFVKVQRSALSRIPAAFVSVSLSEAGVEDSSASPEMRAKAASDVQRMVAGFTQATGWHPLRSKAVAGALSYTRYNRLLRLAMKRIARKAGAAVDTSRDYEYTNWGDIDEFVASFTEAVALERRPTQS
jgi:menaquinone-dependent protoporphyrinogen oxidase